MLHSKIILNKQKKLETRKYFAQELNKFFHTKSRNNKKNLLNSTKNL